MTSSAVIVCIATLQNSKCDFLVDHKVKDAKFSEKGCSETVCSKNSLSLKLINVYNG